MEKDGRTIGQNMFMRTVIDSDDRNTILVLTMRPICITPEPKRRGYGKILLDYSLEKAAALGFGAVPFEGNIGFTGKAVFPSPGTSASAIMIFRTARMTRSFCAGS